MNKKKSIALLVIISVAVAILTVLTFVRFHIPGVKNGTRIYNSFLGAIELDGDLAEGVSYELKLKEDISDEDEDIDVKEVIDTLQTRLSALGYDTAKVTAFKADGSDAYSFRVEMKATATASSDISVVAAYGELDFKDGDGNSVMGHDAVKSAKYRNQSGSHYVELKFTNAGLATLKSAMNAAESGFTLKINLGDSELFSGTLEESYISNNSIFITSQTEENARQLALQISSGGLKYDYEVGDGVSTDPALGKNADKLVFWSVTAAMLAAFIALVVFYGGFGLIATVTAYVFLIAEIGMLILVPGITLNFAGVIGIAASAVLTIFCMVMIMNGVRAEYANGKTIKASVKAAYRRSIFTILDINGILAALSLLMFFICKGAIKCFAVTFGIGAVLSALAAMFFSQLLVYMGLPLFKEKSDAFLKLKRNAESKEAE